MIVVPDNETAKKIPKIEAMIIYREDKEKLYVQGNKQLQTLADEKKVNDFNAI